MDNKIIILGPKKAGKTTYLMSIADCFDGTDTQLGIKVEPLSPDAIKLKREAKDVLRTGQRPLVTPPPQKKIISDREAHQNINEYTNKINEDLEEEDYLEESEYDFPEEGDFDEDYLEESEYDFPEEDSEYNNDNIDELNNNIDLNKLEIENETITEDENEEKIEYIMPDYQFRIDIPSKLHKKFTEIDKKEIYIQVQDYAGEIFDDLENFETLTQEFGISSIDFKDNEKLSKTLNILAKKLKQINKSSVKDEQKLKRLNNLINFINYLSNFSHINKWLLLLNDWEPVSLIENERPIDERYVDIFKVLLSLIAKENKNFQLAVVMGKCERGELWTGRKYPDFDIFRKRLPKTYKTLTDFFGNNSNSLQFFACSSFGVLSAKTPLPNRKNSIKQDYKNAVIREPNNWNPYGLITPFVWLETGERWEYIHI